MASKIPHILFFLVTFTPRPALSSPAGAEITMGPQAPISFGSMESFSTLKPCAQGCLRYNGVFVCGMAGYGDLGSEIGCGCSPQNYCFCDKREASAVTSYIQVSILSDVSVEVNGADFEQSCVVTWWYVRLDLS